MNARLEEAAQIATDYLASLENLPQEAQHLLAEIKHLDARSEELTDKIATETKNYVHHHHPRQNAHAHARAIPAAVGRMYDEVNALAAAKVALSARLAALLERAMARLQHALQRILELEGDEPGLLPTQDFLAGVERTVRQINGLRAAAAKAAEEVEIGLGPPRSPVETASAASVPRGQKRRKADASTGGGKASSSVLVVSGRRTTSQGPSPVGQRRGKHRRTQGAAVPAKRRHGDSADDEEKENEKTSGDEAGENDDGPYCYCGEGAWGEMIACENADCANEWFHLSCAGLEPPLPDVWYCDDCRRNQRVLRKGTPVVSGPASRKGRKKQ
ncbi:transcription factor [Ganoderma sinense ZZ0214-1]|uniref:Chromatin modification-related protein n=1 Tax=Ganoderma sinense ZZ0214-1 TaxID=1077348 RepID=A0A2G8RPY7_9APHY|nr:transcription factor [Ganoderma sinense ZZ0214-1]